MNVRPTKNGAEQKKNGEKKDKQENRVKRLHVYITHWNHTID